MIRLNQDEKIIIKFTKAKKSDIEEAKRELEAEEEKWVSFVFALFGGGDGTYGVGSIFSLLKICIEIKRTFMI
ncbi:MAG: hypothetical protein V8R51_03865 [Clostridia bacterium]